MVHEYASSVKNKKVYDLFYGVFSNDNLSMVAQ